MKRVQLDENLPDEDAYELFAFGKSKIDKAPIINENKENEEMSFCQIHECHHGEVNQPCVMEEKVEAPREKVV